MEACPIQLRQARRRRRRPWPQVSQALLPAKRSRTGDFALDAIADAADISEDAASDVLAILADKHESFDKDALGEEGEFAQGSCYERKLVSSGAWQEEWRWFERSLKTEARFFSKSAAAHLAAVFGDIDKVRTRNRRRLIVEAGPQRALNHLYRARVFQADDRLEEALCRPDLHLGSPPSRLAGSGRMNALGISVFYGAGTAETAIAEVRPPVGSKVVVAKFHIVRPLRLLDLTALENVIDDGSIFDPTLRMRLERVAFLRSLGRQMLRPVMPDDEALDYLATQAVADFLATENDPVLDGVIYRSVQTKGGRNVVLFHKAALVERVALPKGSEVTARSYEDTEDGLQVDYWVSEMVPKAAPSKPEDELWFQSDSSSTEMATEDCSLREAALRVEPHSLMVHQIDWVSYRSTRHTVARHRFEKSDTEDF